MGLHITRAIVATINLLLGGALTYLWLLCAKDGSVFRYLHTIEIWLLIAGLIAMTITAIGAAAHLLRRSTVESGLKWNAAVGACWLLEAVGVIIASVSNGRMYAPDATGVAVLAGIGLLWLSFGWVIRQFLTLESRKQLLVSAHVAAPVETLHQPQTAPRRIVTATTSTTPSQMETVQTLRRQ